MGRENPRRRDHSTSSGGGNFFRRGEGIGGGPVGSNDFGGSSSSSQSTRAGGSGGLLKIILIVAALVFGGGGAGLSGLFGGSGSGLGSLLGGSSSPFTDMNTSSGWVSDSNTSTLNTKVADGSRDKYTKLLGNGRDTNTFMIYMCGADLESRSGMATKDLVEMTKASLNDHVRIIVYTGGASRWQNNVISASTNSVYEIVDGKFKKLKDDGKKSMVSPSTLTNFITYAKNYASASRYHLIFWDHGGGSATGFGHDENFSSAGSMDLAGINKALKNANTKFDSIGFDACLMATYENALMLSNYADYLIGSEETEPGTGWYYTNWLTSLAKNPSMSTIELGKKICDDFVSACAQASQQNATLSVVDLAEITNTTPAKFSAFAKELNTLLSEGSQSKVSMARSKAKSFASGNRVDNVDLVNFADNFSSDAGSSLSKVIKDAVKYNKTSTMISNAYGLSIYFPKESLSKVDSMSDTYEELGIDTSYSKALKNYAKVSGAAQYSYGGNTASTLFGQLTGQSSSSNATQQILMQLASQFLQSQLSGGRGFTTNDTHYIKGADISNETVLETIKNNHIDNSSLVFSQDDDGKYKMTLTDKEYDLLTDIRLKKFYDDGKGYIELGEDNDYEWDGDKLVASTDKNWVTLNGQSVAYYYMFTEDYGDDNYRITGRVPCLLNGTKTNLIVIYSNDAPKGKVIGATTNTDINTIPKNMTTLKLGDKIDFISDYYSYSGKYQDTYKIGNRMTYNGSFTVSNAMPGNGKQRMMYKFVDVYNQAHYSNPIIK